MVYALQYASFTLLFFYKNNIPLILRFEWAEEFEGRKIVLVQSYLTMIYVSYARSLVIVRSLLNFFHFLTDYGYNYVCPCKWGSWKAKWRK